ncbi:MAG: DUF2007 domain-containing protein [Planctomycetes bacterium]|nr:DUF2007 domain-containing protein [Planctomycetota bacterium]
MANSWVPVYYGSFASVLANQATLEASGIKAVISNETMKVLDPFITGGNVLNAEIRVLDSQAEEAREILGEPNPDGEYWYSKTKDPRDSGMKLMLRGVIFLSVFSVIVHVIFNFIS